MSRRLSISYLLCILAYLVVLVHSAVPHDHHGHCHGQEPAEEQHQAHHPHHGSCENLDIFSGGNHLVSASSDAQPHPGDFQVCELISQPMTAEPDAPSQLLRFCTDDDPPKDSPNLSGNSLRAPPAA